MRIADDIRIHMLLRALLIRIKCIIYDAVCKAYKKEDWPIVLQ